MLSHCDALTPKQSITRRLRALREHTGKQGPDAVCVVHGGHGAEMGPGGRLHPVPQGQILAEGSAWGHGGNSW